jgi:hypothetical protein
VRCAPDGVFIAEPVGPLAAGAAAFWVDLTRDRGSAGECAVLAVLRGARKAAPRTNPGGKTPML